LNIFLLDFKFKLQIDSQHRNMKSYQESMARFVKLFLAFCVGILFSSCYKEHDCDSLISNGSIDHVQHFKKLFENIKIKSFLEFGLGSGSEYFLDNCEEVTSCSITLQSQGLYWRERTDLVHRYSNWTPILKYGGVALQQANLLCSRDFKDPALYDGAYLLELKDICDDLLKDKQFEVVFVNPDFHMRGDLVNELFDRVPVIVARDTNIAPEIYGWRKIYTPFNYTKIEYKDGQGMTFWVRHDREDVILALGGKVPQQPRKKLRIFFPITHDQLGKSVLAAFKHLGHALVVPGTSFQQNSQGPRISEYCLFCPKEKEKRPLFLQDDQVEVIENNEIFQNPPDVMFITWSVHELDIYDIHQKIKNTTKLVYFTGNENEVYHKKVENFLVLGSIARYIFPDAHTLAWIPWIDFDGLTFEEPLEERFIINSYLAERYQHPHLKSDGELFESYVGKFFHDASIQINNYGGLPYENIVNLIRDSQATVHIKSLEGFGYSVMESLSRGRPVFLKRSFALEKAMMNWCIEGKTALFFDSYEEFKTKLELFIADIQFRKSLQTTSAETVRRIVNNDQQARKLQYFLEHLK